MPCRLRRKCVVVEVRYDVKIIRLLPPATNLMRNLWQTIAVILLCTILVEFAMEGHVGGDVVVEIVQAIIDLLYSHVKERRKDRLVQSTPQARQSWHLSGIIRHDLFEEMSDRMCVT